MAKEGTLLVVDDNRSILAALRLLLEKYFARVLTLPTPNRLATTLREEQIDVILLDMNFTAGINTGNEGIYWLSEIHARRPDIKVVLFTAYADIDLAVRAMRDGAVDFVVKPWDNDRLVASLRNAYNLARSAREVKQLKEIKRELASEQPMFWGESPAMARIREIVEKVAATDANILITGENGTGKEMLAREIHNRSARSGELMVSVDMGSVPETLFESELFAHVKGAFTDARADRAGKFEVADHVTLFLDEIGNLPPHLQSKLLTAIQGGRIFRVGSNTPVAVDIRLICATNRDLFGMVADGEVREDLLYRINTIHLEIPALRERPEDIIPLAERFITRFCKQYGKSPLRLDNAAREKLMLATTHDINAPLGAATGDIDLLSRLTTGKREGLYLHNMKESSEHLLALVNSLLDFYRLDINKVDGDNVAFCPAQLFETIREGFAAMADAKGIALVLEAGPGAGDEVMGDPFRIRQVADNLISNALKFTDEGSVTIRADVVEGRLVFSVRDTGRGIGREEKERIFQEFVRLRSAQGVDGFGLGLSIVDRLVKLLGGSISLESRLGEGSKFIVSVPVGRSSGKKPGGPPQPARTSVRPDLKVLLIDDDPLQLEMTAGMCRQAGVAAECCQYPEYAAKLVAEGVFDAVITDIQMPSADGFSVLAAVRGVAPPLPVVADSARGEMDAGDFSARGFAGCLRKPFTANELVAVLNTVCGADAAVPPAGGGVATVGAEQAD